MGVVKKVVRMTIRQFGYDMRRIPDVIDRRFDSVAYATLYDEYSRELKDLGIDKAHYGCGPRLFAHRWVNIDLRPTCRDHTKVYMHANLVSKHPFPSDFFRFAFAEDFLEHLDQSESIIFLSEVLRTLQPGGVLRLSFPGLRGVLRRHYRSGGYEGAYTGKQEAYTMWGHKHFYCEENLSLVAHHIGFSDIEYVEHGQSKFNELCNLDSRYDQKDLNIYAELKK